MSCDPVPEDARIVVSNRPLRNGLESVAVEPTRSKARVDGEGLGEQRNRIVAIPREWDNRRRSGNGRKIERLDIFILRTLSECTSDRGFAHELMGHERIRNLDGGVDECENRSEFVAKRSIGGGRGTPGAIHR